MFGIVAGHLVFQSLVKLPAVRTFVHIDKIDHNNTAHIAQTQLTGNFGCGFQVNRKCIFFLAAVTVYLVPAVYINNMERFGVFDDQVYTAFNGDNFTERILDLFVDPEIVENGYFTLVNFNNINLIRRNGADVIFYFFGNSRIVNVNIVELFVKHITENGRSTVKFAYNFLRCFGS
jgi:hypothetical protein